MVPHGGVVGTCESCVVGCPCLMPCAVFRCCIEIFEVVVIFEVSAFGDWRVELAVAPLGGVLLGYA
jgi:hypothetical protein